MKKIIVGIFSLLLLQQLHAQFRFDNHLYKTVFWQDLCQDLARQDGHLLLDVRSKGEYSDTSSNESLNIGHLQGAVNIDVRQLPDRLGELEAYKDKPIYIYCSHSQRSRRASRLLSEKGFTRVVNINGGMTMFNMLQHGGIPCVASIYATSNPYRLWTPAELCSLPAGAFQASGSYLLLDIRPDSVFRQISADERQNAYGRFRQAINIPMERLASELSRIPRDKKIIIVDDSGDESPKAAKLLEQNGYAAPGVLFEGMDRWTFTDPAGLPCKKEWVERPQAYSLVTPEEFGHMEGGGGERGGSVGGGEKPLVLDIRSAEEFGNQAKQTWRNIGNVRGALNIPAAGLADRLTEIASFKDKPVVVYGFSTSDETFASAKLLAGKGFSHVHVLMGGLFDLRWMAANVKHHQGLGELVVNIPADNL